MTEEESDLRMLSQGEEEEERLQFSVFLRLCADDFRKHCNAVHQHHTALRPATLYCTNTQTLHELCSAAVQKSQSLVHQTFQKPLVRLHRVFYFETLCCFCVCLPVLLSFISVVCLLVSSSSVCCCTRGVLLSLLL